MVDTCVDSKVVTWALLFVEIKYIRWEGHAVKMKWYCTTKCDIEACDDENEVCAPEYSIAFVTEYHNLMNVRNKSLDAVTKAALKACYKESKKGFLDCAEKLGISHYDMIDPDVLTTTPSNTLAPDCKCKDGSWQVEITEPSNSFLDFKKDQVELEKFWKFEIANGITPDIEW